MPDNLRGLLGWGDCFFPSIFGEEAASRLGPIPPGTPVGLLANLMFARKNDADFWGRLDHDRKLLELVIRIKRDLRALGPNPSDERRAGGVQANLVEPLMGSEQVPGLRRQSWPLLRHRTSMASPALSDQDKRALIEFLKTF